MKHLNEILPTDENGIKLVSLSEFVDKLDTKEMEMKFDTYTMVSKMIFDYKDFITQPLTKGQFVPCDEEGNVLEEPIKLVGVSALEIKQVQHYNQQRRQYQQAKKRVLFWGAKVITNNEEYSDHIEYNGSFLCYINSDKITKHKTIEQAINNGVTLLYKV